MRVHCIAITVLGALLVVTPVSAQVPWQQVVGDASATAAGFGDADNRMVVSSAVLDGSLYAGTFNHMFGSEVWRSADGTTWTRVNADGFGGSDAANNSSSYSMAVFLDAVYAATWATGWPNSPGSDTRVWRYESGTTWTQVNSDGFGDSHNTEPWAMAVFGGILYVGASNYMDGAEVWRAHNGVSWVLVNSNGFGNPANIEISAMAEYGGALFAATRNETSGTGVWRSEIGTDWTPVDITPGVPHTDDVAAYAMAVFNGSLFLSTFNSVSGGTVYRSDNGTTWTEVAQASGGFGDANNWGSFAMTVYDGALYLGTFNWSTGTEVWRTTDGATWTQINTDGFGNSRNYAVLTWSELNGILYGGLRNDDGCEVWRYPVFFSDGFESGDTTSWSLTVQ